MELVYHETLSREYSSQPQSIRGTKLSQTETLFHFREWDIVTVALPIIILFYLSDPINHASEDH